MAGLLNSLIDKLYTRKVNTANVQGYFERIDLDNFFTNLSYYIDPEELVLKIGDRRVLQRLMYDGEIYAAVDKRLAALTTTNLEIQTESEELKRFFEDQLLNHERQLKTDFFQAVLYGYSVNQIIYKENRSGEVEGFQREDFWRFEPMRDGIHVRLRNSRYGLGISNNQVLDYGKWILTTNNGSFTNPTGESILTRLYLPWLFRCQSWDLWMKFAERYSMGFLIGTTDADNSESLNKFLDQLKSAVKGAALAVGQGSSIQLIQPNRDSSIYSLIDEKTINLFYRVILGETQTSMMAERGSSGSAEVHNQVRIEKTRSDIYLVQKSFKEAMLQIGAVNGIPPEDIPEAVLSVDQGLETERAARDSVLSGTGQIKFKKNYFVDKYGYEEDEIDVIDPPPPSPGFDNLFKKKADPKTTFLSKKDVDKYLEKDSCPECGGSHAD